MTDICEAYLWLGMGVGILVGWIIGAFTAIVLLSPKTHGHGVGIMVTNLRSSRFIHKSQLMKTLIDHPGIQVRIDREADNHDIYYILSRYRMDGTGEDQGIKAFDWVLSGPTCGFE